MSWRRVLVEHGPFREEQGYIGGFTRDQAKGAMPNGTRVEKTNSKPEDTNQDGAQGIILGSISADTCAEYFEAMPDSRTAYFIEWDSMKGYAVGVSSHRVQKAED